MAGTKKPQGPWHLWTGAKRSREKNDANDSPLTGMVSDRGRFAAVVTYREDSPKGASADRPEGS
jgi:hypothetical protein